MADTPSYPSSDRETYNKLQRVAVTNRFIFSSFASSFAIVILFGVVPLLLYLAFWSILIVLALGFERPYRLLRALLPYGNWPVYTVPVPRPKKVRAIFVVFFLVFGYAANLWFSIRIWLPLTGDKCGASLACLLLTQIFK